jgi:hypothetical protein
MNASKTLFLLPLVFSGSLYAQGECNPNNGAFKAPDGHVDNVIRAVAALGDCSVEVKATKDSNVIKWFDFAERDCKALQTKNSPKPSEGNMADCGNMLNKFTAALKQYRATPKKVTTPSTQPAAPAPAKDAVDKILDLAQAKLSGKNPAQGGTRMKLKGLLEKAKVACKVKTAATCKPSLAELAPVIKQLD